MTAKTAKIENKANSYVFALSVSEGLRQANTDCWRLSDASGVLNFNLPKQLAPFLEVNDTVIVNFAVIKSFLVEESSILRPN